ncbi:MAG TPA: diadenylate cyclase CdaA [Cyclobacteriaceae bacterium]|nr:diadenylate cyclase CdaA [Cyclobacteriaceae bacterium]
MIFGIQIGFLELRLVDFFDIGAVSFLLYQVYKLIRGSVAVRIFLGFLLLYVIYLIVRAFDMELLSAILGQFMGVGVIAVIILFQQEFRKFLQVLGRSTFLNSEGIIGSFFRHEGDEDLDVNAVLDAIVALGASNMGAIVVISRDSALKFYAESGDALDAKVSKRLLISIFNKYGPLHDGAVIIFRNRVKAARVVLPISEKTDLPAQFGLRHRAGIGMSEATDTLVVVVSEETGQISIARNGIIDHNLSSSDVRKRIIDYIEEESTTDKPGIPLNLKPLTEDKEINK